MDPICKGAYVEFMALQPGTADILLSLPRPLIPLLEFLYSDAKYSHSSLSSCDTQSPELMLANFCVRYLRLAAWNLFWCDLMVLSTDTAKTQGDVLPSDCLAG